MQQLKPSGSLEEKTELVKHYLKAWANNTLEIGKILSEIQENRVYKEQSKTFEEYIKQTFGFSDAYAYHYIGLYKKYGQNVKQFDKMKDHGMRVLIISLQVPDDYIEEAIGVIKAKPYIKPKEAERILKRFSKQAGDEPRYAPLNVNEHLLKLKREANEIKEQYEQLQDIKVNLKLSIEKWCKSAQRHNELTSLKEEIEAMSISL